LADDFERHGVEAIERVRIEKPEAYIKVIASLLPMDPTLSSIGLQPPSHKVERKGMARLFSRMDCEYDDTDLDRADQTAGRP
jgi:hypothetical protein